MRTCIGDQMKRFSMFFMICLFLSACGGDHLSKNAVSSVNGQCPEEHQIKGNRNTKGEWIYHLPGGQFYSRTTAEECFTTEIDAQSAGYRKSKR